MYMIKQRASGRKDGYARISGLADICERPHMSTEQRKAAGAAAAGRGTNVWSIAGAPERGAMRSLFIYVCEQQVMALKYDQIPHCLARPGLPQCSAHLCENSCYNSKCILA